MSKLKVYRGFQAEFRAEDADNEKETPRIVGYAAVFDIETEIAGLWKEVIRAGAFKKTLSERDQVALWNHESSFPLARKSAGTLTLTEDKKGLRFEVDMDLRDSIGTDVYSRVQRGTVNGVSFGFRVTKEKVNRNEQGYIELREILEVELLEISPVTFPAYEATEVEARAVQAAHGSLAADTTDEPGPASHSAAGATETNSAEGENNNQEAQAELELMRFRLDLKEKE